MTYREREEEIELHHPEVKAFTLYRANKGVLLNESLSLINHALNFLNKTVE